MSKKKSAPYVMERTVCSECGAVKWVRREIDSSEMSASISVANNRLTVFGRDANGDKDKEEK